MVRQAHHEDSSLKTLGLILSLSKDEAKTRYFFTICEAFAKGKRHGQDRLVPHLIVDRSLDAIDFYERAFGADKLMVMMAKDGKRIMHAELDGRVRDPFGLIWAFHAPHKKKDSDEH